MASYAQRNERGDPSHSGNVTIVRSGQSCFRQSEEHTTDSQVLIAVKEASRTLNLAETESGFENVSTLVSLQFHFAFPCIR